MEFEEVLGLEYKQLYEQYRWIGTQQTLVFTLYAAIVAATFTLIRLFPGGTCVQQIAPWFPFILLFLGIIGISISVALIYSRGMQLRIGMYVDELLIQMTKRSRPPTDPAIRFRRLPSTRHKFHFRDTVYIPISLTFILGVSLSVFAIIALIVQAPSINHFWAAALWLALTILFSSLGICCPLPCLLKKEFEKAKRVCNTLKPKDWQKVLRENVGLNEEKPAKGRTLSKKKVLRKTKKR